MTPLVRNIFRALCSVFLFVFSQAAAAGAAFAENTCAAFEGMWQPLYHETYETFPAMREYMDGPDPAEDSFVKGIIEARRLVIDCESKSLMSIQGILESVPRPFIIDSVNEHTLTVYCIEERFKNPSSTLEQELAKELHQIAPRVVFTRSNDLLKMTSEHESFVMRRAAPFQPQ